MSETSTENSTTPLDQKQEALITMQQAIVPLSEAADKTGDTHLVRLVSNLRSQVDDRLRRRDKEPEKQTRDQRLIEWGKRNNANGWTAFAVQGIIIKKGILVNFAVARELGIPHHEDLVKNTGFLVLKAAVQFFDPEIHGENFWVFVRPYLEAGLKNGIQNGEVIIPFEIPSGKAGLYLENVLKNCYISKPTIVQKEEKQPAVLQKPTETPKTQVEPPKIEKVEPVVIPKPNEKPAEPQKPALTDKEMADLMRKERIVEYVQRQVEGGANVWQFDDAVELLSSTYANQAKTTAHRYLKEDHDIKKPNSKQLQSAIDDIFKIAVESFDPPNTDLPRFRGHLGACIKDNILECYKKHA